MDQDQAYSCRFCFRIFPSRSSLGGHVRSHMFSSSSSSNEEKDQKLESNNGFHGASASCYGLRKNPRKTKRFTISTTSSTVDHKSEQQCIICSKAFESWEALYCHMKKHSDKGKMAIQDNNNNEEEEEVRHENSLSSWSCIRLTVPIKRKRSKRAFITSSSSSLYLESNDSNKLQDAVDSLMMLSENAVCFTIAKEDDHVSENVKYDSDSDSDSDYFNVESSSPDSLMVIKKIKFDATFYENKSKNNDTVMRKYECLICKKSFGSYQALGGHNANHRRMRSCAIEAGQEVAGSNSNKHECTICGRAFSSGNALGGHKRSHFIMAVPIALNQEENNDENVKVIDLNVPVRTDDDADDVETFLDESMVTE